MHPDCCSSLTLICRLALENETRNPTGKKPLWRARCIRTTAIGEGLTAKPVARSRRSPHRWRWCVWLSRRRCPALLQYKCTTENRQYTLKPGDPEVQAAEPSRALLRVYCSLYYWSERASVHQYTMAAAYLQIGHQ